MSCKVKSAMLPFPESSLDHRRIQFYIQFGVTGAVNVKFTLRSRLIYFPALVAYEYLLTFYDEVKAIWRRKITGASVLFIVNRYVLIITIVLQILPLNDQLVSPLPLILPIASNTISQRYAPPPRVVYHITNNMKLLGAYPNFGRIGNNIDGSICS